MGRPLWWGDLVGTLRVQKGRDVRETALPFKNGLFSVYSTIAEIRDKFDHFVPLVGRPRCSGETPLWWGDPTVAGRPRCGDPKLKIQNPKPKIQKVFFPFALGKPPRTQNPKSKTQNPKSKTQNPKSQTQKVFFPFALGKPPRIQNPKSKTQNPKSKTQNPKSKTQNPKPKILRTRQGNF